MIENQSINQSINHKICICCSKEQQIEYFKLAKLSLKFVLFIQRNE